MYDYVRRQQESHPQLFSTKTFRWVESGLHENSWVRVSGTNPMPEDPLVNPENPVRALPQQRHRRKPYYGLFSSGASSQPDTHMTFKGESGLNTSRLFTFRRGRQSSDMASSPYYTTRMGGPEAVPSRLVYPSTSKPMAFLQRRRGFTAPPNTNPPTVFSPSPLALDPDGDGTSVPVNSVSRTTFWRLRMHPKNSNSITNRSRNHSIGGGGNGMTIPKADFYDLQHQTPPPVLSQSTQPWTGNETEENVAAENEAAEAKTTTAEGTASYTSHNPIQEDMAVNTAISLHPEDMERDDPLKTNNALPSSESISSPLSPHPHPHSHPQSPIYSSLTTTSNTTSNTLCSRARTLFSRVRKMKTADAQGVTTLSHQQIMLSPQCVTSPGAQPARTIASVLQPSSSRATSHNRNRNANAKRHNQSPTSTINNTHTATGTDTQNSSLTKASGADTRSTIQSGMEKRGGINPNLNKSPTSAIMSNGRYLRTLPKSPLANSVSVIDDSNDDSSSASFIDVMDSTDFNDSDSASTADDDDIPLSRNVNNKQIPPNNSNIQNSLNEARIPASVNVVTVGGDTSSKSEGDSSDEEDDTVLCMVCKRYVGDEWTVLCLDRHSVCFSCIQSHAKNIVSNKQIEVSCPLNSCTSRIPDQYLRCCLPPKRLEQLVANRKAQASTDYQNKPKKLDTNSSSNPKIKVKINNEVSSSENDGFDKPIRVSDDHRKNKQDTQKQSALNTPARRSESKPEPNQQVHSQQHMYTCDKSNAMDFCVKTYEPQSIHGPENSLHRNIAPFEPTYVSSDIEESILAAFIDADMSPPNSLTNSTSSTQDTIVNSRVMSEFTKITQTPRESDDNPNAHNNEHTGKLRRVAKTHGNLNNCNSSNSNNESDISNERAMQNNNFSSPEDMYMSIAESYSHINFDDFADAAPSSFSHPKKITRSRKSLRPQSIIPSNSKPPPIPSDKPERFMASATWITPEQRYSGFAEDLLINATLFETIRRDELEERRPKDEWGYSDEYESDKGQDNNNDHTREAFNTSPQRQQRSSGTRPGLFEEDTGVYIPTWRKAKRTHKKYKKPIWTEPEYGEDSGILSEVAELTFDLYETLHAK